MITRTSALAAVRWTSLAMAGRAVVAVAQIVALSRILDPADFKEVALALTMVNIGLVFSDMGISNALIRFRDVTPGELVSLFWLNVIMGGALTLGVALSSPLVAAFYGDAHLAPLVLLAGTVFLITSLGQQHRALAERDLRFDALFWIDIGSALAGFAAAVGLASLGAGAIAIVLGNIVTALGTTALSWIVLARHVRLTFTFRWEDARRFVSFGSHVVAIQMFNAIALSGDVMLGGKLISGPALGYYFQPRDFCMRIMFVVNPIVTRVSFPLLSSVAHEPARLRTIYLKAMNMTASVNLPIYIGLALFGPEAVDIALGAKWQAAGPLMRSLAIWCAVRSIANPVGSLLLATGRTRRALVSAVSVAVAVFAATAVGARFGIGGIPVALTALYGVLIPVFWLMLIRPCCGAGFMEYHRVLVRPALATLAAAAAGWLAAVPLEASVWRLATGGSAGLAVYMVASYALNREWLTSMTELLLGDRLRGRMAGAVRPRSRA